MNNAFDGMRDALDIARDVQRAADENASAMARMLIGRLQHVNRIDTLRALKKELRDFDMVTGKWRKK